MYSGKLVFAQVMDRWVPFIEDFSRGLFCPRMRLPSGHFGRDIKHASAYRRLFGSPHG